MRVDGLAGAAIGALIGAAIQYRFQRLSADREERREVIETHLLQLQDENVLLLLFSGVILVGIIISSFSAFLAVMRYLHLRTSDLYF